MRKSHQQKLRSLQLNASFFFGDFPRQNLTLRAKETQLSKVHRRVLEATFGTLSTLKLIGPFADESSWHDVPVTRPGD